MVSVGLVVKLTAKAGKEDDLGAFLSSALPLAVNEAGTPIWLALKTDASTFWIVTRSRATPIAKPISTARLQRR